MMRPEKRETDLIGGIRAFSRQIRRSHMGNRPASLVYDPGVIYCGQDNYCQYFLYIYIITNENK